MFWYYEFGGWDSGEIDKFAWECKKWNGMDLTCMDKKIKQTWSSLSNEEKAEAIDLAYWFRTYNLSWLKWDYTDWKYVITLTRDYWFIPNQFEKTKIVSTIKGLADKYSWNTNMEIKVTFEQWLFDQVAKKYNLKTKKEQEKYFAALWYEDLAKQIRSGNLKINV